MMRNRIISILIAAMLIAALQLEWPGTAGDSGAAGNASSDEIIADAFARKANDLWVTGSGRVDRVLADDNKGSRHQRFILELGSGQSILIAHNIDLAPRIPDISRGDVVHWTHHDPQGRMNGGWLRHKGAVYK